MNIRSLFWLLSFGLVLVACAGSDTHGQAGEADPGSVADVTPLDETSNSLPEDTVDPPPDAGADPGPGPEDTEETPDEGPDVPLSPCEARCQPYADCGEAVVGACQASCEDTEIATCEDACLEQVKSCEMAVSCFGVVDTPAEAWSDGPYGIGFSDVANEFVVPTLKGDWSFAANFTGQDSYVFTMTQTGFTPGDQLWKSDGFIWLDESPPNVHYFFMAYHNADGVDDALGHVQKQKERMDETLNKLGIIRGKAKECHWRRRVHYVPESAWGLGNWVSSLLQAKPMLGLAIDRFQRIRQVGLLQLVGGTPLLRHLQYPPEYFNFELAREKAAWKGDSTVVTVFDAEKVNGATVDVELPSKEAIAGFDTLEMDVSQLCQAHDDSNCFEWDYKAFINVREHPVAENAAGETPCQPEVKAVEAKDEVMGLCAGTETPCTVDAACEEGVVCEGYVAAVEAVEPVAADKLPCECAVPGADTRAAEQTCKGDGAGYGDCQCNKAWEVARWITTYHREGRWVMDASAFLPLLKNGGKTRIQFKGSYPYTTTFLMRFYNQGKADRASTVQTLFGGGGFGPGYSDKYEPMTLTLPAGTKRAEIVAFITGHGFGGEPYNCAEFCNHTHHFTVDGVEHAHGHEWINNYYGCAKQVSQGTVPNQFGTWTIGRGGWCPGKDVTPFVSEIAVPDGGGDVTVTITYKGLLDGKVYVDGAPGFGGSIWMSSYLVTYE